MIAVRRHLTLLAVLLLFPITTQAADPAILRLKPETTGPIFVGQRLKITVDVLSATTFGSAPAFDLPTIAGTILMKLEDRPVIGSETIDGTDYTVQTHELWFFALRPGSFSIPAFKVRFDAAPASGQPAVEQTVSSMPLTVSAKWPPGAEQLGAIVCANDFQAEESWKPEPGDTAHVGDSFTRTITMTAGDVPAMVFPSIPIQPVDGLKAYPSQPKVNDHSERGEFTGQRIDSVTYVCAAPGEIVLPALVIPWWNLKESKLEQAQLPETRFQILEAANAPPAPAIVVAQKSHRRPVVIGILLAAAAILAWAFRKPAISRWQQWQTTRRNSESGRFHTLLHACRRNDPLAAINALYNWLDANPNANQIQNGADLAISDPNLDSAITELETAALHGPTPWSGEALAKELDRARIRQGHEATAENHLILPALNPG